MKKLMALAYAVLALFALGLIVWIIPANTEDSGWGLSPALLPYILAGLMLILSLVLLCQTLLSSKSEPSTIQARHLVRLLLFGIVFFGAFPLMSVIGFFAGGVVVLVCLQLLCGQRNMVHIAAEALIMPAVLWACMKYLLQIPLP